MKNVIFLLIDSFDFSKIGSGEYRNSPTPFIDELIKKSYYTTNMYSQAPYTEAALMSTICGCDTLDYNGYLKRYKYCPINLLELLDEKGYETYHQLYPHIYPKAMKSGINNLYFNGSYSFGALWMYRLEYYSDLYKKKLLEEDDWNNIIDLLDDNFEQWINFNKAIKNKEKFVEMIWKNIKAFNINKDIQILREEIEKYENNKKVYIINLFNEGKSHILFKLKEISILDDKIKNDEFKDEVVKKYKKLNKKIYKIHNKKNLLYNHISLRKLLKNFKNNNYDLDLRKKNSFAQYCKNYIKIINYNEILKKINYDYDNHKAGSSIRTQLQHFFTWKEEEHDNNKPYFAYIHADDIHSPSAIFSYDCEDMELIDSQMKQIEKYLNELPKKYRGSLVYDLSLLYLDGQIKWFYNELEKRGMLDDTTLIITGDHGYSFYYYPLRDSIVHSFHKENYNVPFIIVSKEIEARRDDNFYLTKDSAATILDLLKIEKPKSFTGVSVLQGISREFIHMEYMGPGCPDMKRKPIWFCAFDENWKVFLKVRLSEEFCEYEFCELYNLKSDPKELNNLVGDISFESEVEYLIKKIEERFLIIKNNYNKGIEGEI